MFLTHFLDFYNYYRMDYDSGYSSKYMLQYLQFFRVNWLYGYGTVALQHRVVETYSGFRNMMTPCRWKWAQSLKFCDTVSHEIHYLPNFTTSCRNFEQFGNRNFYNTLHLIPVASSLSLDLRNEWPRSNECE